MNKYILTYLLTYLLTYANYRPTIVSKMILSANNCIVFQPSQCKQRTHFFTSDISIKLLSVRLAILKNAISFSNTEDAVSRYSNELNGTTQFAHNIHFTDQY